VDELEAIERENTDQTFAVVVYDAIIVNGFRTEVEADGWIEFQRIRTKEQDA